MISGGSGYPVDIAAISGVPGLSVVLVDENQKIASWNGGAADLFGVPATEAVGRRAADVAGQPRTVTGLGREDFARVIAEQGWWSGSLLHQRRDGSEFLLQVTGLRVPLGQGAGTLWLSHLPGEDSGQQALGEALALAAGERRRLTKIAEAGKLFGSTLDLGVILHRVVTQTAEALGDCCLVQLLDESGTLLVPSATHHNDSKQARVFHDMVTHPRRAVEGVSGRALQTGEPILIPRYEPAQAGQLSDPYIAEGSLHAGIRSMIVAPLITRSTRLGVLVAIRDVSGEPYDETDLQLCADLAERGAQAIYNAQLMADVKRADAERAAVQDRLRHAERMESLGQLVGGIAHDFNNLLNVIAGFSDLLAEEIAGLAGQDPRLGSMPGDVEQIRDAAQRAIRLTRQLLTFARKDVVHPEVLSLNDIITGLEQLLRRTLGEHITLNTAPAGDLWPVKADAGQLKQVLVNLAVNARDAMPGGGKLTIDTANITVNDAYAGGRPGLQPGRYARLRVSDTGTGMPPEVLARVFEPFFTTKPLGQGTGLGPATFYGIITGAGGHAQIYSEPGLGTTVTGLLPATTEDPAGPTPPPATPRRGHGETILLVEDDTTLQELATRLLTRHGYQVRTAPAAAAPAIAADPGQSLDLLLTDVVMPEMLGNEVARRVHASRPPCPSCTCPDTPSRSSTPTARSPARSTSWKNPSPRPPCSPASAAPSTTPPSPPPPPAIHDPDLDEADGRANGRRHPGGRPPTR